MDVVLDPRVARYALTLAILFHAFSMMNGMSG